MFALEEQSLFDDLIVWVSSTLSWLYELVGNIASEEGAYVFLLPIAVILALVFTGKTYTRHNWRLKSAAKCINKLRTIDNPQKQLAYLRKVDAFVYEEAIMTALSDLGYQIERNRRYTGDGGIDGRAKINGEAVYIQAKRYGSYVSAKHVSAFSEICNRDKRKGLFVHTGKTGKLARSNANMHGIDIVSGERMLELLTGSHFAPRW